MGLGQRKVELPRVGYGLWVGFVKPLEQKKLFLVSAEVVPFDFFDPEES